MLLLLRKLSAFMFITAIWVLVFFTYLFVTRPNINISNNFLIIEFFIVIAFALTWLVRRFYFSRSGQNSVRVIAINTLIVNATSLAIFWLVPQMINLFEVFGGDLPKITKLAILIYPYILLPSLAALLILLLAVRAQQAQTSVIYLLHLSHGLLALSSGMSIFYLGAMYSPMICMCSVI